MRLFRPTTFVLLTCLAACSGDDDDSDGDSSGEPDDGATVDESGQPTDDTRPADDGSAGSAGDGDGDSVGPAPGGDGNGNGNGDGDGDGGGAAPVGDEDWPRPLGTSHYDLGNVPFEISWPMEPTLTDEVEVMSAAEFSMAAGTPGTRVVVTAPIPTAGPGELRIAASDIEVTMEDGASLGVVTIQREVARVALLGGRYQEIFMTDGWDGSASMVRPEWIVEDVLIDGVYIDTENGTGVQARGNRIAIVNSTVYAGQYDFYCGNSRGEQSHDIIIAGNRFSSDPGIEATVRLVHVVRSVTMDNELHNVIKHSYRVHGISDLVYASGNTLIETGLMIGTMPGDEVGDVWFMDNTFYHAQNSLFQHGELGGLVATGNVAYTEVPCFVCVGPPADPSWTTEPNELLPYQDPPDAGWIDER